MGSDDRFEALAELLREPAALADSTVRSVQVDSGGGGQLVVALLLTAMQVYKGIRTLIEAGQAEEARILWRTLLEDAALLLWFAQVPANLEVRALRYHLACATDARNIQRAAERAGYSWAHEMEAGRQEELEWVETRAKELGVEGMLERMPSIRAMLEELGDARLYYWHARASQAVHSTSIALATRLDGTRRDPDGTVKLSMTSPTDQVVQVGLMAAETFMGALQAAANLLGWDGPGVDKAREDFSARAQAKFADVVRRLDVPE